jgi:lysophospholipase L1-like esterase
MPITGIGSSATTDPVASLVSSLEAATAASTAATATLSSRQVIAGTGLTGGGTLAADRTFTVDTVTLGGTFLAKKFRAQAFTVFLGDSITNNNKYASAAAVAMGVQSNTEASVNAGVFGNTTAQMLARFDTDVTPRSPRYVHILGGTNDTGQSIALATIAANIKAIVAKVLAINAEPILATIPPNGTGSPADRKARVSALNQWICRYALANGYKVADYYRVLVDPATGGYQSVYDSGDGTHPTTVGHGVMATELAAAMTRVPDSSLLLPKDNVDPNNWVVNGLFLNGSNGSTPTSWSGSAPANVTLSLTTGDSAIQGTWFGIDAASSASTAEFFQNKTAAIGGGGGTSTGDLVVVLARFRTPTLGASQTINLRARFLTGAGDVSYAAMGIPNTTARVYHGERAVQAGSNGQLQFDAQLSSGTGRLDLAQCAIYNLTAMGVVDSSGDLV